MTSKKEKYFNYAFFLIATTLFIFMHCYRLNDIPNGTHIDEMGMGYDAWCISKYGVDRYLKSFPLYLTNFGGGQSSLYCYICCIFVKFFGLSNLTMRIPAVIFSFLTVFYGAKIINLKYRENKTPVYIFVCLYIIFPYFTMSSRFGLDCNLMLGMSTVFLYYYILAIKNGKSLRLYFISGIIAGLILYTYALSYIVLPIFLLMSFAYLIYIRKIKLTQVAIFSLPLAMLALPLIFIQFINVFNLPEIKLGIFTLTKLPGYRGSEFSFSNILANAKYTLKSVLLNDWLPYNISEKFKTMYIISIPILCVGFCNCICEVYKKFRKQVLNVDTFILCWLFAELIMGCLLGGNGPNANKLNGIFFALAYLVVDGLVCILNINYDWKKPLLILITLIYMFSYVGFTKYYFSEFQKNQYLFSFQCKDAVEVLSGYPDDISSKKIYVDSSYIYFLGSTLISPYSFNISNDGVNLYKNYIFDLPQIKDVTSDSIYIVLKSNEKYIEALDNLNLVKTQVKDFYVFH